MHAPHRIVTLLLLTGVLAGCHKVVSVPVPRAGQSSPEEIVGAVLTNGSTVTFLARDGRIRGDTLYASETPVVPLDSVNHLMIRKAAPELTFFAVLGGVAAAMGITAGIVAATKESCPFVYSWDGSGWVFDAEPYGGAVTRGLERDDYGRLEHLRPTNGEYRLRLTNEVNESQMTDLVRLLVVDHPAGVQPMPDEFGRFHAVIEPAAPLAVVDQSGTDLLTWVARPDNLIWEVRPSSDLGRTSDTIVVTFAKPSGAMTMKLVARVATGLWGSHQIRSQLSLFGSSVDAWYQRLDASAAAADSVRQWSVREGLYRLNVEVREPDGWKVRGVLTGGGPLLAEDRVVPLDVSRVEGPRVVLRLMPARSFWGFNWLSADFSSDQPLPQQTLTVTSATDRQLGDVRELLVRADGQYHPLPTTGDFATLTFPAPPDAPGLDRTVFVHARGWYHLRGLPGGAADSSRIEQLFREPGFAARMAAEEFRSRQVAQRH